jgi:hypothetical protein
LRANFIIHENRIYLTNKKNRNPNNKRRFSRLLTLVSYTKSQVQWKKNPSN